MSLDLNEADEYGNVTSVTGADQLMEDVTNMLRMKRHDRSTIVEAGAPEAEKTIRDHTPYRVHNPRWPSQSTLGGKRRNPQHIKEGVTHKPNQYMDGSTDVGYTYGTAAVARWANEGTYRQPPQFFFEHAINDLDTDKIFGLQNKEFEKLIKSRYPKLDIQFK